MLTIDCKSCGARFSVDVEVKPDEPHNDPVYMASVQTDIEVLYYCIFCSSAEPAED